MSWFIQNMTYDKEMGLRLENYVVRAWTNHRGVKSEHSNRIPVHKRKPPPLTTSNVTPWLIPGFLHVLFIDLSWVVCCVLVHFLPVIEQFSIVVERTVGYNLVFAWTLNLHFTGIGQAKSQISNTTLTTPSQHGLLATPPLGFVFTLQLQDHNLYVAGSFKPQEPTLS